MKVLIDSSWCHIRYHPPKGVLVLARHNDAANEWGALTAQALNPLCISYAPKINSGKVQGEKNGSGARFETGKYEEEGNQEEEAAT